MYLRGVSLYSTTGIIDISFDLNAMGN